MNIIGKSECTASQMAQYLIQRNPNAKSWALEYAQIYLEEGEVEGVRGDGAWVQSCKETHYFIFDCGTAVTFDQNNFCGLGVTKKGVKGHSFNTPRLGIRAQIQHLKGYATSTPLKNACIDPRYKYITPKGKAHTFEELAGKWAIPGYDTSKASSLQDAMNKKIGYGFDIIKGIEEMKKIKVDNKEVTNMPYKVAIDSGHYSNSAGKRSPEGYREHWITTNIAYYLDIALKRCGIDTLKVAWNDKNGKDDFVDISLSNRQKMIKNAKCDISISCHANAHGNGSTYTTAQGIETFIHSNSTKVKDSKALANKVQSYLIKGTKQTNRGVKSSDFAMCNCTAMGTKASILIEYGFMTNRYEEELMKSDKFCLECAEETAHGICDYFGIPYKTGSVGAPVVSTPTPSAQPQPTTNSFIYNGLDYSLVFNPTFYSNAYADLKKAFGTDSKKLFEHYLKYGVVEGRQAISIFNPKVYKSNNKDLQNAFGDKNGFKPYVLHYLKFGKNENRKTV